MASSKTQRSSQKTAPAQEIDQTPECTRPKSIFREYAETIILCVLALVFIQGVVVMRSKVPTKSMLDTLLVGDYILINRALFAAPGEKPISWLGQRAIRRGDVLVFQSVEDPELDLVKRVVALPGETIEIIRGQVFIDGNQLDEPYVIRDNSRSRSGMRAQRIPEGSYFMMGDNRDSSRDSRYWGPVPRPLVKGRAFFVWWSYMEQDNDHLNTGFQRIVSIARKIPRIFSHTRWKRLFSRIR